MVAKTGPIVNTQSKNNSSLVEYTPANAATQKHLTDNAVRYTPADLRARRQWVTWRFEQRTGDPKPTKVLYNPATNRRGDSTDKDTWASFDDALAVYQRGGYDGLGFVVTNQDPFVGVDLDHCIDDQGNLSPDAARWVAALDSYTEITPSNHGVRVWLKGDKPGDRSKNAKLDVEIYQTGRFFTFTGNHLPGTPTTVNERQAALSDLYHELFPTAAPQPITARPSAPTRFDDAALLEKMFNARNGHSIRSLWNGSTTAQGGDRSAADLALCGHLAFWTGGDPAQMDRLFRQSGLMRPKWDRRARAGELYGPGTIARAIANCREFFTPTPRQAPPQPTPAPTGETVQDVIDRARVYIVRVGFKDQIEGGSDSTNRRVADAILDIYEERQTYTAILSSRAVALRAGVGRVAASQGIKRFIGTLISLTDHPINSEVNGAKHYRLSFCADRSTRFTHSCYNQSKGVEGGGSIRAKTLFTTYKAADAFNTGGSIEGRNRALVAVLGAPTVKVLIRLEAHDKPRRDAWAGYRAAVKDARKDGPMSPEDHARLTAWETYLDADPQPVPLCYTVERYDGARNQTQATTVGTFDDLSDWKEGIAVLTGLGAATLDDDTITLDPAYSRILGREIAPLGPLALRILDALIALGQADNQDLADYMNVTVGAVSRACSKLEERGVIVSHREGLTKIRCLANDWLGEIDSQTPTMRTYGLQIKREIADASAVYNYCDARIEWAEPAQAAKLRRRRDQAQARLVAAMALEAPVLAADQALGELMHPVGPRKPQAPALRPAGQVKHRVPQSLTVALADALHGWNKAVMHPTPVMIAQASGAQWFRMAQGQR